MCGIVGLLVKKREQRPALGRMAGPMFTCMGERGPDSGGLAVFGPPPADGLRRFNLFVPDRGHDWQPLLASFRRAFAGQGGDGAELLPLENHAILLTSAEPGRV